MIVCDFDIVGITVNVAEADAPLVVDGDSVLSHPVACELVEPIPARNPQVI